MMTVNVKVSTVQLQKDKKMKQMPPYQHLECFLSAKERTLIQLRKSYTAAS